MHRRAAVKKAIAAIGAINHGYAGLSRADGTPVNKKTSSNLEVKFGVRTMEFRCNFPCWNSDLENK